MKFLENKKNVDVIEYLQDLKESAICICSETSLRKASIDNNINNNILFISTKDITKRVEKINEYIESNTFKVATKIISIGGGTAIDIGKYISYKLNRKLVCIPTMLSTNAYSTNKVALLVNGLKVTLDAKEPDEVLIDEKILSLSKEINIYGLADILSIHTATKDWELSVLHNNEEYSSEYWQAKELLKNIKNYILNNEKDYISKDYNKIYEFIGRSGELTNHYGSGKPESGSEHIFAKEIERNIEIPHGLAVIHGIIIMSIAQNDLNQDIIKCIKKIGLIEKSKEYGITSSLIKQCLYNIKEREDRYTVVNLQLDKENIFDKYYDIVWSD